MLKVLVSRTEIAEAQRRWNERTLAAEPLIYRGASLGWQGGGVQATIYWLPVHGLWVAHETEPNRWWNPCGLESPEEKPSPDIVVEINPPHEGLNAHITGAFAVDSSGKLYLVHRGWLGGGYHPVTKETFFQNYRGRVDFIGPRLSDRVAVVGEIDSPTFLEDLAQFARACRLLKSGAKV